MVLPVDPRQQENVCCNTTLTAQGQPKEHDKEHNEKKVFASLLFILA